MRKGSTTDRLRSMMGTTTTNGQHTFHDDILMMNDSSFYSGADRTPVKIQGSFRVTASRILKRAILLLPIAALTALWVGAISVYFSGTDKATEVSFIFSTLLSEDQTLRGIPICTILLS